MNYDELIAMALKGRSVNSMAKVWGLPQPTLDSYVKGKAMPDFDTALKITREAGAPEKEAWEALAERTRMHKAAKFKLQMGFAMPSLLTVLALVALAVNLFLTPLAVKAAPFPMEQAKAEEPYTLYYVKSFLNGCMKSVKKLRAVWTWFKRVLSPGALMAAAR